MRDKTIFARGKPKKVEITEKYFYSFDLYESSIQTENENEAEGSIIAKVPFDGDSTFSKIAASDVQRKLLRQSKFPLSARIGYLSLTNNGLTNLDKAVDLVENHNVIPVNIKLPLSNHKRIEVLSADQSEAIFSTKYSPLTPQPSPLKVCFKIVDNEFLAKQLTNIKLISIEQLIHKYGVIDRGLFFIFDLEISLFEFQAKALEQQKKKGKINKIRMEWPLATSKQNVVAGLIESIHTEAKDLNLVFNPQYQTLEWGEIDLQLKTEEVDGKTKYSLRSSSFCLFVNEPAELFNSARFEGLIEIEIPTLMSGLNVSYFDALGNRQEDKVICENEDDSEVETDSKAQLIEQKSIIEAQVHFNLQECVQNREYLPSQHLFFEGVIMDALRISDIKNLLIAERFDVKVIEKEDPLQEISPYSMRLDDLDYMLYDDRYFVKIYERANPKNEIAAFPQSPEFIKSHLRHSEYIVKFFKRENPFQKVLFEATRPEGPQTLTLWIMAERTDSKMEREKEISGKVKYRADLNIGNTIIFIQGKYQRDHQQLILVMNRVQTLLKKRFQHVRTLE